MNEEPKKYEDARRRLNQAIEERGIDESNSSYAQMVRQSTTNFLSIPPPPKGRFLNRYERRLFAEAMESIDLFDEQDTKNKSIEDRL